MPKAVKAGEVGLKPHYKVRVVLHGAILHLASWDQPEPSQYGNKMWEADWINDPAYGDTIGEINWLKVNAITWRWSE